MLAQRFHHAGYMPVAVGEFSVGCIQVNCFNRAAESADYGNSMQRLTHPPLKNNNYKKCKHFLLKKNLNLNLLSTSNFLSVDFKI